MKEKVIKAIIVGVIVLAMFIPVIIEMAGNKFALEKIEYEDFNATVNSTKNYGFALVYVGPSSSEYTENNLTSAKDSLDKYKNPYSNEPLEGYYLDSDEMSDSEKKNIFGDSTSSIAYLLIANGTIIDTITGNTSAENLEKYISSDSGNTFSEDFQKYKVAKDADEYKKLVKDKKTTTMAVFGSNECVHCNMFKVIYNKVAKDYNANIYYFDSSSYDKTEYEKVMDLGLKIPAECTSNGEEKLLKDGFNTPTTLFTKNNKVVDCIAGFVDEETLIKKLKDLDMIKTE